jgi:hypothetical protein
MQTAKTNGKKPPTNILKNLMNIKTINGFTVGKKSSSLNLGKKCLFKAFQILHRLKPQPSSVPSISQKTK